MEESAERGQQPVGIQLEIGAPLGDAALGVDQDHQASVHDPLARDGVESESADHAAHVVRRAGQQVPARLVDAVAVGIAAQHFRAIGHRVERDRDEAHAPVELLAANQALGARELGRDQRAGLGARREDEAHDEDAAAEALGLHGRSGLVDQRERRHRLGAPARAGGQEHAREHRRQRPHAGAPAQCAATPLARAAMASAISAYPAGMSTGSRWENHWIEVADTPATASSTPKEPSPQCVSEETLAPSKPTTPAPLSELMAPHRVLAPPRPRYRPTSAENETKNTRLDHVSSKLHTATP